MPTLSEVMRAFPRTPINVEIKGRTPDEETAEYVRNAEVLARLLKNTKRRDLIVVSFQQAAVDRFHELAPRIDLAPGIGGAVGLGAGRRLARARGGRLPGADHLRLSGQLLQITTKENVARAHAQGYAWQNWFSSDDRDYPPSWRRLVDMCVDGIMTARPDRARARAEQEARPGRVRMKAWSPTPSRSACSAA